MTWCDRVDSIRVVIGDLAPLCDQHHAPMRRSLTIPQTFQGCAGDEFCRRRYHPLIGYYGGLFPARTEELHCTIHFHRPLYVCAYDAERHLMEYACPEPGCEHVTEWVEVRSKRSFDYQA
jgi:hypothetical protein